MIQLNDVSFGKPPIGRTEMLILEYLATNKDSLIQPMQKAISKHYKVVYESTIRLVGKELVEYGKLIKSEQSYKLTFNGICFILAYSKKTELVLGVLRHYEEDFRNSSEYTSFLEIERKVEPQVRLKILRITGKSALDNGLAAFNPETLLTCALAELYKNVFSNSEMREFKRVGREIPKVKNGLKQIAKNLNQYLDEE